MNRLSVAVCDEDSVYSRKLSEYLKDKGSLSKVCFFEAGRIAELFAGESDICLIDSAIWSVMKEKLLQKVQEEPVCRKLIICLAADEVAENVAECPRIYKYQSADIILQEIYQVIAKRTETGSVRGRKKGKTIGLISPWYDGMSLLAGIAMAGSLSGRGNVLYINSRGYHGMIFSAETKEQTDISDVLLALRIESGNAAAKIMSGTISYGKFSCMIPVHRAGQIADITGEDYARLLNTIWKSLEYDYVVIELQPELADFRRILEFCDAAYSFLKREYGRERLEGQLGKLQMQGFVQIEEFPKEIASYCNENTSIDPLVQAGCMQEWMEALLSERE